jgi:hypothetical protein
MGRTGEQWGRGARHGEQLGALERVVGSQARLEQLAGHSEREVHLELAPAGAHHERPLALGEPRRAGQQTGLPNARGALEKEQGAVCGGVAQAPRHQVQLRFALDQLSRHLGEGRRREGPNHAGVVLAHHARARKLL